MQHQVRYSVLGSRARTQIHEEKKESASILVFFFMFEDNVNVFYFYFYRDYYIYDSMMHCVIQSSA